MKVLQVITKGEIGGAQSHVLTLCRELACKGVDIHAAIGGTEEQPPLAQSLRALRLPVHRLPALGNSWNPLQMARALRLLVALVRRHSPDLLHAHSAMAGVVARLAGMLTGTPVVYTVHGFAFKAGSPWKRRAAAFAVEWVLAPLTRRMVCVSEYERQLARRLPLPSDRVTVIHNGIEDVPLPGKTRTAAAETLPTIAMVARMAPPKRPDLLLHALSQLRAALGHEIPATFFGGGPDLLAHRELAARLGLQAASFPGDVDGIPARLAHHAIFVLASDHEGLPISLIEAMRAGMAIVASDLPGIRELLPDAEHAILVAPNATALSTALRQLIESPALRACMGVAARLRYEQHFTAERMGRAVRAAYATAIPRTPKIS
ncbi:glycosyltransferase family 4 protein [Acidovorax sp. SUPP3334]|uniref:glycosyltransferase family 4 protein n=1 Tax=Acidovorax sp. SUPP3334 TaxID=2920881 RepID=UPI0023DE28FD|nr:glycosyltransferase family 4 protein [Acidovorax sp. SUPP3334]GKT25336.1 glycosyltransferase [Acidovorax sp. SUPP3334]